MSTPVTAQGNTRAGMCPHGLPPAACPICSGGMSGAGKMKNTAPMKKAPAGQWSYMKCVAEGMAIKERKARMENAKNAFERQIEFAKQLSKNISLMADKIHNAIKNLQAESSVFIQKALNVLTNFVINPVLNLLAQIPKIIEKFAQFQQRVAEFIQQAGEKLSVFLADIKGFFDRNIDNIKKKAKKFFLFFMSNIEDENYKNDENLAIFKSREIKKFIVKIFSKNKKRENNAD